MALKTSLDLNFFLCKMKKAKFVSYTEIYSRYIRQMRFRDLQLYYTSDFTNNKILLDVFLSDLPSVICRKYYLPPGPRRGILNFPVIPPFFLPS